MRCDGEDNEDQGSVEFCRIDNIRVGQGRAGQGRAGKEKESM